MEKMIARLQGHYIVCGIGRVGSNVAAELLNTGRKLVVIESDREALDNWLEDHPDGYFLHHDAADDEALQKAGVGQAAGVFAVTADDSHNLMVALSVKMLNPRTRVVVRLHDIRNTRKARTAGADEIVSPDFTGGMRIASAMVRPHAVNFIDQMMRSDQGLRVEEVIVPPDFSGARLEEVLPPCRDYLLMAVHENERWLFNPAPGYALKAGDILVLMTDSKGRSLVEKRLRP